ncbi:hypothetical protein [Ottowia sp. VDI28]|uniref:hypothetical protein n=1 Tax=Ottowia sp. VDI28 TaxID=3133968 RepID=UPI003C2AF053
MKAHDVLDQPSVAEAEMARVAHNCLVAALDHSNAEVIKVTIEGGERLKIILPQFWSFHLEHFDSLPTCCGKWESASR